ncbi:4-hydroxy-tetrahydrodipicolinate synthase [uncultured Veillonella sp.]|uniref:4-hydroxy-tetrahydrodipicolinate synthase n=1 Tax=uncultured Veillonella sp. TaxID=159268 RepID=UPI0025929221|nr:4-hydroxy-tetrahydrodipicolinate synthase [uncultured Veillonella sp.]
MKTLGRVLTAMITPFHADGSVDFDGAVALANHLLDNGSDGIVVCGTTGESPTIANEDKLTLFRRIVDACGDKGSIIANTGSNDTLRSVEFTKQAAATGVDAVMAVVPYYNKPNQKGLYAHFKAIAEATTLPIIVYNVPGRTGGKIIPATIEQLHRDFPNIVAVKEASGDVNVASEIYRRIPTDFMIYSGDDGLTLPILAVGGCGIISVAAHVVGKDLNEMIQAFERGEVTKAREIHARLLPIFDAMFVTTNPIPVKYAVRRLGLPAGPFHLPMCEPSEEEAAVIDAALEMIK